MQYKSKLDEGLSNRSKSRDASMDPEGPFPTICFDESCRTNTTNFRMTCLVQITSLAWQMEVQEPSLPKL